MKTKRSLIPLAALFLSVVLPAVAAPPELAEDVKVKLKVGETYRYRTESDMVMDMMGQEQDMSSVQIVAYKALSVKDGWTIVEARIEELEIAENDFSGDADLESIKAIVFSFEVDELGQTRNLDVESEGGGDAMAAQAIQEIMRSATAFGFMGVGLPKRALNVGTTWVKEIKAEDMFGEVEMFQDVDGTVEVQYEITKFGTVDDRRVMTIASIMTGSATMLIMGQIDASMEMESQSVTLMTVSDGLVYSSESEISTVTDAGAFQVDIRGSTKTKRLMK